MLISSARTAENARNPSAQAAMRTAGCLIGFDKGFRQAHRLGIGKRLIHVAERVRARAYRVPRDRRVVPFEDPQRAHEMADFAAPAAANLEMLAVDLPVHVDRARARVGVVTSDDVAPAVA